MTGRPETVGEEVARRRRALGMSVAELSRRSGVYRDTVTNVETGVTKNPQAPVANALRKALDEADGGNTATAAEPVALPTSPERHPIRVTVTPEKGGPSLTIEAQPENLAELERLIDVVMPHLMGHRSAQAG